MHRLSKISRSIDKSLDDSSNLILDSRRDRNPKHFLASIVQNFEIIDRLINKSLDDPSNLIRSFDSRRDRNPKHFHPSIVKNFEIIDRSMDKSLDDPSNPFIRFAVRSKSKAFPFIDCPKFRDRSINRWTILRI